MSLYSRFCFPANIRFLLSILFFFLFHHGVLSIFHETTSSFTVLEGSPIGTTIGRIELNASLSYRISGRTYPFDVDLSSGRIFLTDTLDREHSDLGNGTVVFLVISSSPPSIQHVIINVLDVNDNDPTFSLPFQNVSIVETAPIGSQIPILPASDQDQGLNGTIVSYKISPEDIFRLVYHSDSSNELDNKMLYLELMTPLDRENMSTYVFNLTATDGGQPSRSGFTTLYVDVLDVNDNAPIFKEKQLDVNWNGLSKNSITKLQAKDADFGQNGQISYSIPSPMESEYFEIVNENELKAKVNHPSICLNGLSTSPECLLTVRATDGGSPPLSSSQLVHIVILNENLHDPEIHIRLQPANVDFAVIDTDADIGRTVAVLTVTDEDGPLTDKSSLDIVSGNDDKLFSLLNQRQFSILRLTRKPDDQLPTVFDLEFQASDGQSPPRRSQRRLRVYRQTAAGTQMSDDGQIWSVNDIHLVALPSDSVNLAEDVPIGTFVALISGNLTGCRFHMMTTNVPFAVDVDSGIITTTDVVQTTSRWKYELEISVLPPPPVIRPINTYVTVHITDVNDHTPIIENVPTHIEISEDTAVGTQLWAFHITDLDLAANAEWTVELLPSEDAEFFRLTPLTSSSATRPASSVPSDVHLLLQKNVDFEQKRHLTVAMRVTDNGLPALSSSVILNFHVVDVNDNRPEFSCHEFYITLPIISPIGTEVVQLTADDKDMTSLKKVRYIITSESTNHIFQIDSFSGKIQTTANLAEKSYTLQVTAIDEGLLTSSENVTLHIMTTTAKDLLPFLEASSDFNITDLTAVGQSFGNIKTNGSKTSTSSDVVTISSDGRLILSKPIEHTVSVSIMAHHNEFTVSKCLTLHRAAHRKASLFPQRSLGLEIPNPVVIGQPLTQLSACVDADCEYSTSCMMLKIEQDGLVRLVSDLKMVDHIKCDIRLLDSSGHSDQMKVDVKRQSASSDLLHLRRSYGFRVPETTSVGTVIGQLPNTTAYIYKLKNALEPVGNVIGLFPDGKIYVRRHLSHHEQETIRLDVEASHKITNSSFFTKLIIHVEDVNEYAPSCLENMLTIEENKKVGTSLGYISAQDSDYGRNGLLRYQLLDHQDELFLSSTTGQMKSLVSFDFEKVQNFTCRVNISDRAEASRFTVCKVQIIILDVNDNAPIFNSLMYRAEVDINDKFVTTVQATDLDTNQNGNIVYKLMNYQDVFTINPTNGTIENRLTLLPLSIYNVTIRAEDMGSPALNSDSFVIVRTKRSQNQAPLFLDDDIEIYISHSFSMIGSVLGVVRAQSEEVIKWSINDQRIVIDSWGKLVLADKISSDFDAIVTATTNSGNNTKLLRFHVNSEDSEPGDLIHVKENQVPVILRSFKSSDLKIIFIEPSSKAFELKDGQLTVVRPLDREMTASYRLLLKEEHLYHLIRVQVDDVNDNEPDCTQKTIIVPEIPFTVHLSCSDPDTSDNSTVLKMQSSDSRIRIIDTTALEVVQELDDVVSVVHFNLHDNAQPTSLTLLRGQIDPTIQFPAGSFSLLLSSATHMLESFGRITAECPLPLQYFVVGSSSIGIDRYSGELIVAKEDGLKRDSNVTVVAVSARGIATTEVMIEVIEDSLHISSDAFILEVPHKLSNASMIGELNVGRSDVHFITDDPFVLIRDFDVILRRDIPNDKLPYQLKVEARKGRLSAELKLILISSLNSIAEYPKRIWVRENAQYGTVVGSLPRSPSGDWQIVEDIGLAIDGKRRIVTTRIFDHEEKSLYSFHLKHTDDIDIEMQLFVEDDNDNPPKILNDHQNISVFEDFQPDSIIGKIDWEDLDQNNIVHFDIIEGNEFDQFKIDSNGFIRLVNALDRERVRSHQLKGLLRDGLPPYPHHSVNFTLYIEVLDVNDNAPQMTSATVFSIMENSPLGTHIGQVSAHDPDDGDSGRIRYRILPESLPMGEVVINGVTGELKASQLLDYEQTRFIEFIVEASDYGFPSLSSQHQIRLVVLDANDHAPKFVNNVNATSIGLPETSAVGHVIHRFVCEDADATIDNRLTLFWLADDYSGIFSIRPLSGQLIVASEDLDFEKKSKYDVVIHAQNLAGGPIIEMHVEIEVIDENDEAPHFINGCPAHFEIYENVPAPAIVGSTVADDDDEGANGLIAYSIMDGNMTLFSVNSTTGIITSLQSLDREESAEHRLTIQVTDSGRPRLSSTCDVFITILDENDNSPIFEQPYYMISVLENQTTGSNLTSVRATDADSDENGRVTYRILKPDDSPFKVNPHNGSIVVASQLDRETTSLYELVIEATDHSRYRQKTSSVIVYIEIEDVNDNAPIIRNAQLDVFIPSNLKSGDIIHIVDAFDADLNDRLTFALSGPDMHSFSINEQGEIKCNTTWLSAKSFYSVTVTVTDSEDQNTSASFTYYVQEPDGFPKFVTSPPRAAVREHSESEIFQFQARPSASLTSTNEYVIYSILAGNGDNMFQIDSLTGMLKSHRNLNNHHRPSYRLWIQATNSATPPRASWQLIEVLIDDVNDNPPVFDKVIYSAKIEENLLTDDVLVRVHAKDSDLGENGRVSYSIIDGNHAGLFTINDETGEIRCVEELDREQLDIHRLIVMAQDHGAPSLNSTAIVQIHVLDVDDNSPRFTRIFHGQLPEDTPVGSEIIRITATDVDVSENYNFVLENHQDVFQIEANTGVIHLIQSFDREKKSSYRLMVRVDDGSWSIRTNVMITVSDVNDNDPVFEKDNYFFYVKDTSSNITDIPIGAVKASDLDSGVNGKVRYHLQRDNSFVIIDPKTGFLTLIELPKTLLKLIIVATDSGSPERSTTCSVLILWEDAASSRNQQSLLAFRNSTAGTSISKIDELEKLIGIYPENVLNVTDSGHVHLIHRIHMNQTHRTTLDLLMVSSSGAIIHLPLELLVADEIIKPFFRDNRTHVTVLESMATLGYEVITVDASNDNPLLKQTLHYEIINSNELPFEISSSGVVIVSEPYQIDFETRTAYNLHIVATSGGYNSSILLEVKILDDNDNVPNLVMPILPFLMTSRKDIFCIHAHDADSDAHIEYVTSSDDVLLDAESGCLTVTSEQTSAFYQIMISAMNSEELSSTMIIEIFNLTSLAFNDVYTSDTSFEISQLDVCTTAPNGTILWTYSPKLHSFLDIQSMDDVYLSRSKHQLLWSGRHHDVMDTSIPLTIYEVGKFGRDLSIKHMDLHLNPLRAPAPVLEQSRYEFNITETIMTTRLIHDFHWILPSDCHPILINGLTSETSNQPICLSPEGKLTVCGTPSSHQYRYIMKIIQRNHIVSEAVVTIRFIFWQLTNHTTIAYVRENTPPISVIQLPMMNSKNTKYSIANTQLQQVFSISNDGIISTLVPLDRETRSIYRVPVSVSAFGQPSTTSDVIVIVDDIADSVNTLDAYDVHLTIVGNQSSIIDVHPASVDVSRRFKCLVINEPHAQVNSSCFLRLDKLKNSSLPLMASDGLMPYRYTVSWTQQDAPNYKDPEIVRDLIAVTSVGPDDGIVDLLSTLRDKFPDLSITPFLQTSESESKRTMFFTIRDRNNRILKSSDALPVIQSFVQKTILTSIDVESIWRSEDICERKTTTCQQVGYGCKPALEYLSLDHMIRGQSEVWSIPEVKLVSSCQCLLAKGCLKDDVLSTTTQETRRLLKPTASEKPLKKLSFANRTCETHQCGSNGHCVMNSDEKVSCQCDDGFIASHCDLSSTIVTLSSSAHILLKPTKSLRHLTDVILPSQRSAFHLFDDCDDGRHQIQMDFRTLSANSLTLLTFDYGDVKALVEIRKSQLVYILTDGYRNPIEIQLSQSVSDGKFHTLTLELSADRKTMTVKVDGVGKEARSMKELPGLLSDRLRVITVGLSSKKNQKPLCVRKLLVNRQLQPLKQSIRSLSNQYFFTNLIGHSLSECSDDITQGSNDDEHDSVSSSSNSSEIAHALRPGVLALIIAVGVLVCSILITVGIWKLWRHMNSDKCPATTGGWMPAKEIRAFTMLSGPPSTLPNSHIMISSVPSSLKMTPTYAGHINTAMTLSATSLANSDDDYEVPMQPNIHLQYRPEFRNVPQSRF